MVESDCGRAKNAVNILAKNFIGSPRLGIVLVHRLG